MLPLTRTSLIQHQKAKRLKYYTQIRKRVPNSRTHLQANPQVTHICQKPRQDTWRLSSYFMPLQIQSWVPPLALKQNTLGSLPFHPFTIPPISCDSHLASLPKSSTMFHCFFSAPNSSRHFVLTHKPCLPELDRLPTDLFSCCSPSSTSTVSCPALQQKILGSVPWPLVPIFHGSHRSFPSNFPLPICWIHCLVLQTQQAPPTPTGEISRLISDMQLSYCSGGPSSPAL